jgi:hypothetical protein
MSRATNDLGTRGCGPEAVSQVNNNECAGRTHILAAEASDPEFKLSCHVISSFLIPIYDELKTALHTNSMLHWYIYLENAK